jgi:hypothetical protein
LLEVFDDVVSGVLPDFELGHQVLECEFVVWAVSVELPHGLALAERLPATTTSDWWRSPEPGNSAGLVRGS